MTTSHKPSPRKVRLTVIPSGDGIPIGLHAVPGRLPEVRLLPGETWVQMIDRASGMVTPGPDFWTTRLEQPRSLDHA